MFNWRLSIIPPKMLANEIQFQYLYVKQSLSISALQGGNLGQMCTEAKLVWRKASQICRKSYDWHGWVLHYILNVFHLVRRPFLSLKFWQNSHFRTVWKVAILHPMFTQCWVANDTTCYKHIQIHEIPRLYVFSFVFKRQAFYERKNHHILAKFHCFSFHHADAQILMETRNIWTVLSTFLWT